MKKPMTEKTTVFSISALGWTVYRVRTTSSRYHLALFLGDGSRRRKCGVLRGTSEGLGRSIDIQDSAPLIGGRSIYDVPPQEWVGSVLEIGTATTSPIREVAKEEDRAVVTSITSSIVRAGGGSPTSIKEKPVAQAIVIADPKPEPPRRPAYPEDHVEGLEQAANWLRMVYRKTGLVRDLERHPELLERFQMAFGECRVLMEGVAGQVRNAESAGRRTS
jgi:hypothetical protein